MDWDTWNKEYGNTQIEKWRDGINLRIATDTEIREYTSTRLYEYTELHRNSFSWDVWTCFWEDFNYFTAKDFARLGLYYLKELRE